MKPRLQPLFEAHVKFELSRLQGAPLQALIAEHGEAVFAWLAEAKLGELSTPAQIMGVIDRYVIELRVGGGITELAGEMSRAILALGITAHTRLDQIMSAETFADFADKVETLRDARRALIEQLIRTPSLTALISRVATRLLVETLFPRGRGKGPVARLRGSLAEELFERFGPMLTRFVEERTEHTLALHRAQLLEEIGADSIRAVADDLFDALSQKPFSDGAAIFTPQDLEDFVVLGYEFWLKFRKTEFFRQVVAEVVDKVFAKYGQESLVATIEDLGIDPALILGELQLFAGPVMALAARTGFLEARIRALLAPFYASSEAEAALG